MSILSWIAGAIGVLGKPIVQLVRETSRKPGPAGTGHWYGLVLQQQAHGPAELERDIACYYCGYIDARRSVHTKPPCPGKGRVR
jgi:hypothetical protein